MRKLTSLHLYGSVAALTLGVAGDGLLRELPLALNLALWLLLLLGACLGWAPLQEHWPKHNYALLVIGMVFAITFVWRDVKLDRRAHNPILAQAQLDKETIPIPWLGQKRLRFTYS